MTALHRVAGMVAGLIVVSCILACGAIGQVRQAAAKQKTRNDLLQLGLLYHNFNDTKMKGPANMAEFQAFDSDQLTKDLVAQTGPGGMYVLIWNIKISELTKAPAGTSGTVLGYEAQAPTNGGMVLMGDGFVREMTAAEFNAAPKAQPGAGK